MMMNHFPGQQGGPPVPPNVNPFLFPPQGFPGSFPTTPTSSSSQPRANANPGETPALEMPEHSPMHFAPMGDPSALKEDLLQGNKNGPLPPSLSGPMNPAFFPVKHEELSHKTPPLTPNALFNLKPSEELLQKIAPLNPALFNMKPGDDLRHNPASKQALPLDGKLPLQSLYPVKTEPDLGHATSNNNNNNNTSNNNSNANVNLSNNLSNNNNNSNIIAQLNNATAANSNNQNPSNASNIIF
jgi:hypothetical protein